LTIQSTGASVLSAAMGTTAAVMAFPCKALSAGEGMFDHAVNTIKQTCTDVSDLATGSDGLNKTA